jgi:hypothetical protein
LKPSTSLSFCKQQKRIEWTHSFLSVVLPIGSLTIKGNKTAGLAGDFAADINVGTPGSDATVLSNLKIAGALTGQSFIHGSMGTATINILKGRLNVERDVKSLKVNHNLVTMSYPKDAGELVIGGKAVITAGKDIIKVQKGAELFGSQDANLYCLEDLRRYNEPGASWTYHASGSASAFGNKETFDCEDYTINIDTDFIDGHDCNVVETSGCGADLSTGWYTEGNQTHLVAWSTEGFDLNMDVTLIPQQYMQLGQKYSGTGSFSGTLSIDQDCTTASGDIDGSVSTTTKLLGHEEVTVDAGTFLAAKVEMTMHMRGSMDLYLEDTCEDESMDTTGSFTASIKQTWWGVPGIGIVKAITKPVTIKISAKGAGSATMSANEVDELISYSP